ncbi:MAG: glycosyltransferase family 2 protein [Paludibacteraceae bacterium]|nr:glycosyltransferase family 2 protein [Paludibacteraceae bacterium]
MKLTVVIVNYKVRDLLLQCLDSLLRNQPGFDYEVVVVDNHSDDGSPEAVARYFPEVNYIELADNKGFAYANNQAVRQSRADYVLLLNPDTILPENALARVVAFADKADRFGALGVKMIDARGRFLPESKRNEPTLWNALLKMCGLPGGKKGGYYRQQLGADETGETPVLAGAFMLLNRRELGDTCLLDEDFFMFGEDIDLSVRIRQSGRKNYYLPVEIIHYKGESTRQDQMRYIRDFYDAMLVYYRKHYRHGRWLAATLIPCLKALHRLRSRMLRRKRPEAGAPWVFDASQMRYAELIEQVKQAGQGRRLIIQHPDLQMEVSC